MTASSRQGPGKGTDMRRTFAILTIAGLIMPLAACAEGERVWLMVNGGRSSYGMSDLNRDITAFNQANAGSGMAFPLVKSGTSLGGAVGCETPSQWNFGVGYDRLYATSEASNASGALRYEFTADAWRAFGEYALRPIGSSSFRVGAGIGYVSESGKVTQSSPGNAPQDYHISGVGPLYDAYAGGDWWATGQFALAGAVGYRYAKLSSIDIAGGTLITTNGQATGVDYSGPYVRMGIKLVGKGVGF